MFWSTEDRHRHLQQQNCFNNYQVVQHPNGIPQATAAVAASQQQHPTPLPPHPQPQQHQQQHPSHRAAQMQMPSQHYAPNQQIQSLPHPPLQQHQHHHQWATRATPLLTAPPFLQQLSTPLPNSAQYCNAPPSLQFYHSQPRVTQASAVSSPPQQRPFLPPGTGMYPILPQAATALRQNVISQPTGGMITPTATTSAQQMQVQYFMPSYCQQPNYSHPMPPTMPEASATRSRPYAIPIIDPTTRENVLERDFRRSESASPADVLSIAATKMTLSADMKESENDSLEEEHHIPQTIPASDNDLPEQYNSNEVKEHKEIEEDKTDSSVQLQEAVDHVTQSHYFIVSVESIEAIDEVKEEEQISTITEQINVNEAHGETQSICTTPTTSIALVAIETENEVVLAYEVNESKDIDTPSLCVAEKNLSPAMEAEVQPIESPKFVTKVDKQAPPPLSPTTIAKKPQHNKKTKKNKRLKDSQKKQKADLINNESNNNTNKISNQNQNTVKQILLEPHNRLIVKAKELSGCSSSTIETEDGKTDTTAVEVKDVTDDAKGTLGDHEKIDERSETIDEIRETPNTNDGNDQSPQIYESPKLTKSEQIASEILGVESTDDNELLFLNSSMSGFEEDICSSPLDDTLENDTAKDIHFGDFSQENLTQELSMQMDYKIKAEVEKSDFEDVPQEEKKYAYTMQALKSFASEPASKMKPTFKNKFCDIIVKNPVMFSGSGAKSQSQQSHQQNQMFQHISYKDSLNYLNKKSSRRMNDVQQPHQQFQQQCEHQHQRKPDMIRIHLSLNEDIQLAKSENAWVPAGLSAFAPKSESAEDEVILKKIRGILNKLTPENFDKLLASASNFPITGEERMKKVMLLIFEKTVSEPDFAPTYACFCKFLFNAKNRNAVGFDKILINRIQDEFEGNVNNAMAKNSKLKPVLDRLAAATDPKDKAEIKAELDEQEYQFRRRAWGTVRFIGEMFKLGFFSIDRVCWCLENLCDTKCEEKLEYMCKLLTTVGPQLEPVGKHMANKEQLRIDQTMEFIFKQIQKVVKRKNASHVSSRVRFMMQDVLELRARSWDQQLSDPSVSLHSREVSPAIPKGPYSSQQRDRGGHQRMGNNHMSSTSGYEKRRQPGDEQKKSSNIDMKKLLPVFNKDDSTRTLGPTVWINIGRSHPPLAMQQASCQQTRSLESKEELSSNECKRLLNGFIQLVIDKEPMKEWFAKWKEIAPVDHAAIVYHLLTEYLQMEQVRLAELNACARLFTSLLQQNLLTRSAFNNGYQKFSEICDDILVDVPMHWQHVFNFIGPLLQLNLINFEIIWDKNWYDTSVGDKFLQSMIKYFTSEFGANYMRFFWEDQSLQWKKFIAEERVTSFIGSNRFEFIDNDKCAPPIFVQRTNEELVQHIKSLLAKPDRGVDLVIGFISTNVHIECSFFRDLIMFLCDYTVIDCNTPNSSSISKKSKLLTATTSSYRLNVDVFKKKCTPLLRRCIDSKDKYELICLNAIVEKCKHNFGPSAGDVICAMFTELDEGEIISKESFEKWHQQLLLDVDNNLINDLNEFFKNASI